MRKTVYVAVAIWIVSLLLATPDLVIAHVDTSRKFAYCSSHPNDWGEWYEKFRTMFRFLVLFACPLIIITVFYSAIAYALVRRSHDTFNEVRGGDAALRQLNSRRKVGY